MKSWGCYIPNVFKNGRREMKVRIEAITLNAVLFVLVVLISAAAVS